MSDRVVLHASAALEAALSGHRASAVLNLLDRAVLVVAPGLCGCEVANGLWKYVRAGDLQVGEAAGLLESALGFVDRLVPDQELAQEALAAAAAANHPVYDMMYAVLARRQGCTVCTLDGRFAKVLQDMSVPVASLE